MVRSVGKCVFLVAAVAASHWLAFSADKPIQADGVVVYSPGALGKDFAVGKIFSSVEDHRYNIIVHGIDGTTTRVLKKDLLEVVTLGSFTDRLISEKDVALVKKDIEVLNRLSEEYRTVGAVASRLRADAENRIANFEKGLFLLAGSWRSEGPGSERMGAGGATAGGEQGGSLTTLSGRVYAEARPMKREGDQVSIRHSSGFSKIHISELPEEFVNRWSTVLSDPGEMASQATPARPSRVTASVVEPTPMEWTPSNIDEASSCAVVIEGDRGSGSGFLCHVDGITYIYTNVHVLAGSRKIRIMDQAGNTFTDFAYVEAASGFDNGDLVRLALSDPPPKALKLAKAGVVPVVGTKITAIGNSQGSGVLRTLRGEVEGVGPSRIEISADIVQGNSGGPILNEAFEVIGVSSFGELRVDIWSEGTEFDKVRRFGLRPAEIGKWDRFEGPEFIQIAFLYDQLVADIALVSVLNSIGFSARGLEYDPDVDVIGGLNANEVVNCFEGHLFANALLKFNKDLANSSKTGNLGLDLRDLLIRYAELCSSGQVGMANRRRQMLSHEKVPFYIRKKIEEFEIMTTHGEQEKQLYDLAIRINAILN